MQLCEEIRLLAAGIKSTGRPHLPAQERSGCGWRRGASAVEEKSRCSWGGRRDKIGLAVMAAGSSESEVLAQELESLGQKLRAVETRLAEVERIIEGLEAAAQITARALDEVSTHWDSVYRAMRRAE